MGIGNPFAKWKDKTLTDVWESCKPDMNVTNEPIAVRDWSPCEFGVKFLVAEGDMQYEVVNIAKTVMQVQTELMQQFKENYPDTKLLMSIDTFMDNEERCRHATNWTDQPIDMLSQAQRWSCFQTNTLYGQAFDAMRNDAADHASMVIMIGSRFGNDQRRNRSGAPQEDSLETVKSKAKALFEQKDVRVFALPMPGGQVDAYRQIAEAAGGVCQQASSQAEIGAFVREITQTVFAQVAGEDLKALPPPANDAQKLRTLLLEKLDV